MCNRDFRMDTTYKLLLLRETDGRYSVTVPSLPGCFTFGENLHHALEMAKEAIELYLEELADRKG